MLCLVILVFFSFAYIAQAAETKDMPPDGIYLVRPNASKNFEVDYRPEYITDENLVFYTCLEGIDAAYSSLVCKDNYNIISEVPTLPWKWGCFISHYDLNNTACNELIIQTEYPYEDEIQRIQEEIVLRNFESIPYDVLLDQKTDGGWGDAVSTAYSLWVFSTFNNQNFENTYQEQIEDGLTWLKNNRDENEKCWPGEECNTKVTAMILAFLTESGLEDEPVWHRIVHDGKIWLEKQQNLFDSLDPQEGDPSPFKWKLMITGEDWTVPGSNVSINYTTCIFDYADEYESQVENIEFGEAINFTFTPIHNEQFSFVCSENDIPVQIFDHKGNNIFNTTTTNMTYVIPGPCWDDQEKWQHCDVETTIFGAMSEIGSVRKQLAVDWLTDALNETTEGLHFNTTKSETDTAWYLYNRFGRDEGESYDLDDNVSLSSFESKLVRWLMYNQNNDGSWGNSTDSSKPIKQTAIVAMALHSVNNGSYSESIADANKWISLNEPAAGWDTVEKNSLSFLTFSRSAKPFIRAVPLMVEMKSPVEEVQLYNPSSFDFIDLEFVLDSNLKGVIEVDPVGSLLSDYYKNIRILQKKKIEESETGYLRILNDGLEISRIPIIARSVPRINITTPSEVYIFGGKGMINFNVKKSPESLDCELSWEDAKITTKSKFTLGNTNKLSTEVAISEVRNQDVAYSGEFECTRGETTIKIPVVLNTKQFDTVPFSVNPTFINVSSTEETPSFTVYNNVEKPIVVEVEFKTEDAYLAINDPIVEIPALDSYEITLSSFFVENETVQYSNEIEVSAYGKFEIVDVSVDVRGYTSRSSLYVFLLAFGSFAAILGVGGYFGYKYRDRLMAMVPPQLAAKLNILQQSSAGGDNESKVDAKSYLHLAELIKIMIGLGQDEDEINKRLKSEGYNDGEIAEVLAKVKDEIENEESFDKEEKFMKLMKSLETDVGTTRAKLKQEGFTDAEIQDAFKQTEEQIANKEKELKQKATDSEKYNLSEEEIKEGSEKAAGDKAAKESGDKKE